MSTLMLLAVYHSRCHLPLFLSLQRLCTWWSSWKVLWLHHRWSAHGQSVIHYFPGSTGMLSTSGLKQLRTKHQSHTSSEDWRSVYRTVSCGVLWWPHHHPDVHVPEELHSTHTGIYCTKSYARAFVWWPKLDEQIEQTVHDCSVCQSNHKSPPEVPMQPWQWSNKPWDRVHVDHFGPYRSQMFLLIDSHSKWVEVSPVSSSSSAVTISKLRTLFATHGLPCTIVSDNGTAFTSAKFQEFCRKHGIHYTTFPAYHPASNRLAECGVGIIKEALSKQGSGDIQCKLDRILFRYWNMPHTTTGQSPAVLLLGRRPRGHLDQLPPTLAGRVEGQQLS